MVCRHRLKVPGRETRERGGRPRGPGAVGSHHHRRSPSRSRRRSRAGSNNPCTAWSLLLIMVETTLAVFVVIKLNSIHQYLTLTMHLLFLCSCMFAIQGPNAIPGEISHPREEMILSLSFLAFPLSFPLRAARCTSSIIPHPYQWRWRPTKILRNLAVELRFFIEVLMTK